MRTSHEIIPAYSPELRIETLQTARVFGSDGEVLIWRSEDAQWSGRLIVDIARSPTQDELAKQWNTEPAQFAKKDEWSKAFDEHQILLGTKATPKDASFYLLSEGLQGLLYAVPLPDSLLAPGEIDDQHLAAR